MERGGVWGREGAYQTFPAVVSGLPGTLLWVHLGVGVGVWARVRVRILVKLKVRARAGMDICLGLELWLGLGLWLGLWSGFGHCLELGYGSGRLG